MPVGHGTIDYLVVALSVVLTAWLLTRKPVLLLFWLPLLLTVDFFIPFLTQITPSRVVPLMIGAWLMLRGLFPPRKQHFLIFLVTFVGVGGSFIYSYFWHDLGTRSIFRSLHYFSLLFVFLFTAKFSAGRKGMVYSLMGLFFAALVHAAHAIYQQAAHILSLPYRGIIYSDSGGTVPVLAGPFLRVNGFADEPKRLGYVLITGALVGLLYMIRKRHFSGYLERPARFFKLGNNFIMSGYIMTMLFGCFMTFSGSFFFAAAITISVLILILSVRVISAILIALPVLGVIAVVMSGFTTNYIITLQELFEERMAEIDAGLESDNVYRQEFYAQALVAEDPTSLVFGLGIGRYNQVFSEEFGVGAGYDEYGALKPLNSQFYEVGFDLGMIGLLLLYLGCSLLFVRTRGRHWHRFVLSTLLLFLAIQSLFIDDKFYIAFVAALCVSLNHDFKQRSKEKGVPLEMKVSSAFVSRR